MNKQTNKQLLSLSSNHDCLVFLSTAWSRRPRPEPPVQLARFGEARRQRLHRDQPRVWDGDLHRRLPPEHRQEHHSAGQHRPVSDGAGGHQTRPLPRDGVPKTAQQQQQTPEAALALMWRFLWSDAHILVMSTTKNLRPQCVVVNTAEIV